MGWSQGSILLPACIQLIWLTSEDTGLVSCREKSRVGPRGQAPALKGGW